MTTSHALHLFASSRATGAAAGEAGQVAAGAAVTLAPQAAMTLRIAEGQAWVTLGQGLGDRKLGLQGQREAAGAQVTRCIG